MKILLATYWKIPHLVGVFTYIMTLKKQLEQLGHQVDVLGYHPDFNRLHMISSDPERNGKSVYKSKIGDFVYLAVDEYLQKHFPHVDPWIRWNEIEQYFYELASSLFDLNQYDIIHSQDIISTRAISRVKPPHIPLIATIHGMLAKEYLQDSDTYSNNSGQARKWWHYLIHKEYLGGASADRIIVPSKWLANEFGGEGIGIPPEKLDVVPYGLDMAEFLHRMKEEPSPPIRTNPDRIVITCPARMFAIKGHETLIEALRIVKSSRDDFVCWMIGDGDLRKELEALTETKGLSGHVVFMGKRNDVPALLHKSDIIAVPSLHDNLPFSIIEAQSAGKAVVGSGVGGIPEMIRHRATGLLFERGNSAQLAEQLLELMAKPALRKRLSAGAKAWGQRHWSISVFRERTMGIYEDVLKQARNRNPQGSLPAKHPVDVDSLFKFELEIEIYGEIWSKLLEKLPERYSIPDFDSIKRLETMNAIL